MTAHNFEDEMRSRRSSDGSSTRSMFLARWARKFGIIAASIVSLSSATSAQPIALEVSAPGAFYEPRIPAHKRRGQLLGIEKFAVEQAAGNWQAWRIRYTTAVNHHQMAVAVATVFIPNDGRTRQRKVIAWAHGTTGLLQKCMPSLVNQPTLGIPALREAEKAGWAIVATDYAFIERGGPHPYLIGEGEARSVLDAVRAARHVRDARLGRDVVVWGHSQGGHAAIWTGALASEVAPELRVKGVVAVAPATDLEALFAAEGALNRRLGPYLAAAYARFYPDVSVSEEVAPQAAAAAREMAGLCAFAPREDPARQSALLASFSGPVLPLGPGSKLLARLRENQPDRLTPMPLLIMQGANDVVVPASVTDKYVTRQCGSGQKLTYWKFPSLDHRSIVNSPDRVDSPLAGWTASRFAGQPVANGCDQAAH